MCNGARTQSFRTRSSRSERRAHLCERIYALNISKTKAHIEKFSRVKSVLFLIFHRKTSKNRWKKNFFLVENFSKNFSKFFFGSKKKKFFFDSKSSETYSETKKKFFFWSKICRKNFLSPLFLNFVLIITQKLGQISKNIHE